eukprot:1598532-Karenia_brevis.AAC.1
MFATPLESTLDMIESHLDLREETNYTDIAKWRKIKERYEKGTLHYAVPHLFHHKLLSSNE